MGPGAYSRPATALAHSGTGSALVLERSLGKRNGLDSDLWYSLPFAAEVIPDLPIASSWLGLYEAAINGLPWPLAKSPPAVAVRSAAGVDADRKKRDVKQSLHVQTIAAQVRSRTSIRAKMLASIVGHENRRSADAFLCVSGSHPARRLPGSSRVLQSSFSVLRTAVDMKRQGHLPESLALWAVENPLTNAAGRLQDKVAAGATVIITQPPLVWDKFENWYHDVYRSGVTEEVDIVVGLPFLTSASSLRFWITLCDAWSVEGVTALVQQFQQKEMQGKSHMQEFSREWNSQLIDKVKALPGLSGMHVMPITKQARMLASGLLL